MIDDNQKIPLYKVGQEVKIIKYGSLIWVTKNGPSIFDSFTTYSETDTIKFVDISPGLIGQRGVIDQVTITQEIPKYALKGPYKYAWYDEEQLQLI